MVTAITTSPDNATHDAAIAVNGMDCASCVAHVSKAARSVPGVQVCDVNLARGRATIKFDPAKTTPARIAAAITESGYPAAPESPGVAAGNVEEERLQRQMRHANQWLRRAIAGFVLWFPVEAAHWTLQIFFPLAHAAHGVLTWMAFITSTIAITYVGSQFYKSAWGALRRGTSNMDTLIALGASVAYIYSVVYFVGGLAHLWPAAMPERLYFMEASALLALVSLGHWLEARARQSAGSAIRELLNLAPATALRLRDANATSASPLPILEPGNAGVAPTEEVPVADLHVGDRVLVRP